MADTVPSTQIKLRPVKNKRSSAPPISTKVADKYRTSIRRSRSKDEAPSEESDNKLLMSRNFASTHFMDGSLYGETSIADLSQVECLQSLAKSAYVGRSEEEEEEEASPSKRSKRRESSRRSSTASPTARRKEEEENLFRKEEEEQEKRSRIRRSRSGSQRKESSLHLRMMGEKEDSQRRGRSKSKSKSFSLEATVKDQDKKSKRKSRSTSKSLKLLEGMEIECKTDDETLSIYSTPNLPSQERRKNGKEGKSKRASRASLHRLSSSDPNMLSGEDSDVKATPTRKDKKGEEGKSKRATRTSSHRRSSSQSEEDTDVKETTIRKTKNGEAGKYKRTSRPISRRRSIAHPQMQSDEDDEKDITIRGDKSGDESKPKRKSRISRTRSCSDDGRETPLRPDKQRESKSKRISRSISRRKSGEGVNQNNEKHENTIAKGDQDKKEGEAKAKLTPRANSRRRSTERPKKEDGKFDPDASGEKEEGEESKSRHVRGGSRLCPRRRSTMADEITYTDDDNDDVKCTKGRMRRSKSHEMAVKKKKIRKSKSMTDKTALRNSNADADDDTVVADNKSDASPARRVRSSRRSSISGSTTPTAAGSATPTHRRVTRRRASLTASVTEAMAEAATEGSATPTHRRTSRRRASGSHRSGQSSGTGTPTSINTRQRTSQRSSLLVGGNQLRQALQQEPNLTPACLKDLEDIDNVKLVDRMAEQPPSDGNNARDNNKQQLSGSMPTIPAEDTDMETDASEQAAITTRLPTAYLQSSSSSITYLGAMDKPESETFAETRARRTAIDRLSWSSHHGRSLPAETSTSTEESPSSSSYHEPSSSSTSSLSTSSDHGTRRASSRLSFAKSQDALSMLSMSGLSMSGLSSLSSKIKKDLSLSSSSDHGGQRKSWFPSFAKQSGALDMPSSSGHGTTKRAASPSRRAVMYQRGSAMEQMHASCSSAGFADLMHASTSSGFVLPMVKGSEASTGSRRASMPIKPKEKKVSLRLPKLGKFDDLDGSDSSDDFAY